MERKEDMNVSDDEAGDGGPKQPPAAVGGVTLADILNNEEDAPHATIQIPEDARESMIQRKDGMCVECEDKLAVFSCEECADDFCRVCFQAQHRKGKRTTHKAHPLTSAEGKQEEYLEKLSSQYIGGPSGAAGDRSWKKMFTSLLDKAVGGREEDGGGGGGVPTGDWFTERPSPEWFLERSKYVPMRLTLNQRKFMRLVEAALDVSDYTSRIDTPALAPSLDADDFANPQKAAAAMRKQKISNKTDAQKRAKRVFAQLREVCAVLSGMVLSSDYAEGLKVVDSNEFKDNSQFFRQILELGRRHKIRNPEKMRSAYGKLVYMLQDSQMPEAAELLGFSVVAPIFTVHGLLESKNMLKVLNDPYMALATGEIMAEGKPRYEIDRAIKNKANAITHIAKKYSCAELSEEAIRGCLLAFGDNHSYLRFNRDPCDRMIRYLTEYFKPDRYDPHYCLAIQEGEGGARLTHTHETQYNFALQSLTLWREILHDMYKLWCLAEEDLVDPNNPYELVQTGQGLHRVQQAPRISKAMHNLLYRVQTKLGANGEGWVGSSVIHLGDTNVPNALMFIDKYNQVSRILLPIVTCLRLLDEMYDKEDIKRWIDGAWGGLLECRMTILHDFFRSAFDGSGADNFFQAGSCIDGRLTSAWHWCSQLEKKPYYPVFLLTGFTGFDGKF